MQLHLPDNTGHIVGCSFAWGLIFGTCRDGFAGGTRLGSLWAIASLIHALITPFFKYYAAEERHLTWGEEMVRGMGASLATIAIARACGVFVPIRRGSFIQYGISIAVLPEAAAHFRNLDRANWIPV